MAKNDRQRHHISQVFKEKFEKVVEREDLLDNRLVTDSSEEEEQKVRDGEKAEAVADGLLGDANLNIQRLEDQRLEDEILKSQAED